MTIAIKWSVENMTRNLSDGFVVTVSWGCTASCNGIAAFFGGTSTFTQDGEGFTPYDQLTKEQVLNWVYESIGDKKNEIQKELISKVEKQLNPVTANGVPWKTQESFNADEVNP